MAKAEPPESSVRPATPRAVDEGDRPALQDLVGPEAYARYERTLDGLGSPERAAVVARIERGQGWGDIGRVLGGVSEDQARTTV